MSNIIGILTLTATAVYAVLTYFILKVSRNQLETIFRPYITITHRLTKKTTIKLYIKNTGKTNAENLHLRIDRNFYQLAGKRYDLAEHYAFKNIIESFPPEAQLTFALMSSVQLHKNSFDKDTQSPVFSIIASYSYSGKSVEEKTTIDLRPYVSTFMPDPSIEDRLEDLTKEISEIKEIVTKLSSNNDE